MESVLNAGARTEIFLHVIPVIGSSSSNHCHSTIDKSQRLESRPVNSDGDLKSGLVLILALKVKG
jgi:hypothetical protein